MISIEIKNDDDITFYISLDKNIARHVKKFNTIKLTISMLILQLQANGTLAVTQQLWHPLTGWKLYIQAKKKSVFEKSFFLGFWANKLNYIYRNLISCVSPPILENNKMIIDKLNSRGFSSHLGYWTGHEDYYDHTAQELYQPVVNICLMIVTFIVMIDTILSLRIKFV